MSLNSQVILKRFRLYFHFNLLNFRVKEEKVEVEWVQPNLIKQTKIDQLNAI